MRDAIRVALERLVDATYKVPIKQHDRTPEEQAAVEAFTDAYLGAQAALADAQAEEVPPRA